MEIYVLKNRMFVAIFEGKCREYSVIEDYYFYEGLIEKIKKVTGKDITLIDIIIETNNINLVFKFWLFFH